MPNKEDINPGYLFAYLNHAHIGRPLILRHAFGTQIPEIAPDDVETLQIGRLGSERENSVAEKVEKAFDLRDEADELETAIAAEMDSFVAREVGEPIASAEELGRRPYRW